MFSRRSVLALASGSLLTVSLIGCQPAPKPQAPLPPPPASINDAERLQSQLQQRDPAARVGIVVRVRTDSDLAAVKLAPGGGGAKEPQVGDAFVFVDSSQHPYASGSVFSNDDGIVVLKYVPSDAGHAPVEGAMVVHVSTK